MSSEVRFAAMMPAIRAVPSTSPFLALPETISASVALLMTTRPSATADALGRRLFRHIDHARFAPGVDMGEGRAVASEDFRAMP